MKRFAFLLLMLALLAGCAARQETVTEEEAAAQPQPIALPATFSGDLACDDCIGIHVTLNLRADNLYLLRVVHGGPERDSAGEASMGRWRYAKEGEIIVLGAQAGSLGTFAVKGKDHLRLLDIENEELPGDGNDLWRQVDIDPFTDQLPVRGMFSYQGKQAVLTECYSQRSFPVANEGVSYIELEEAYLKTPHGRSDPLLVSFTGSFREQADFDSRPVEEILVHDFTRIYPDIDCSGQQTQVSLTGTNWLLAELDGQPVVMEEGRQRPFFQLEAKKANMHGFGGCNRFFGTYLLRGEVFVFNKLVGTRIACIGGTELEDRFFQVLRYTESYTIENGVLLLLDRNEKVLAKLEGTP